MSGPGEFDAAGRLVVLALDIDGLVLGPQRGDHVDELGSHAVALVVFDEVLTEQGGLGSTEPGDDVPPHRPSLKASRVAPILATWAGLW